MSDHWLFVSDDVIYSKDPYILEKEHEAPNIVFIDHSISKLRNLSCAQVLWEVVRGWRGM